MGPLFSESNLNYLPKPNRVEFFLSEEPTEFNKTKTVFVVPFTEDNCVVLAHNRRRGYEIPGGHIEEGEDFHNAAKRELKEEVGCEAILFSLGHLEMTSQGSMPFGWKYPHPIGYQQFFVGLVTDREIYLENDECLEPYILRIEDLENFQGLNKSQKIIIQSAYEIGLKKNAILDVGQKIKI